MPASSSSTSADPVLGPGVRRRLPWVCWITISRLALLIPFIYVLLHLNDDVLGGYARPLALGLYVVMALSDWLDGFLARRLGLTSTLGAILDPIADKVVILSSLLLLAWPATAVAEYRIPDWVVLFALSKDAVVLIGTLVLYLSTHRLTVRPNLAGKLTTFAQLILVLFVLASVYVPDGWVLPIGTGLSIAASVLAFAAMLTYTRSGLLAVHDTPPGGGRAP